MKDGPRGSDLRAGVRPLPLTVAPTFSDAPGVKRIALPTPWMGSVNVYLLEGDPLTLVDTGPGLSASTAALVHSLHELGYAVDDIEQLIVTHQHFDHMGAALRLVEGSGAAVAGFGPSAPFLADYRARAEREDDWVAGLMQRHGIPAGTARAARMFARLETHLAEPITLDVHLAGGDVIRAGGRDLRIAHRPGHSPSDLTFHDEHDGLLLAADHLLGKVTSNALLALPLDAETTLDTRPRALVDYRRSLSRTRDTDAALVLPGHGEPFFGHRALIDDRLRQQDGRASRLLERLRLGPRTAFALAEQVWAAEASGQAFLVLSEVLGHLDLLLEDGRAQQHEDDGLVRFAAT